MGFLVREADVDAVMDHIPSAAAASFIDERGVIRAAEEKERGLFFVFVFSLHVAKMREEK